MSARNRTVLSFLLCLIVTGHTHAQTYVVVDSTLVYRDVSESYAKHVYYDILAVVRNYLADDSTEYFFYSSDNPFGNDGSNKIRFYRGDNGIDISAIATHTLLDLNCDISRHINDLVLMVTINDYRTEETYLSVDITVPFFRPEAAVAYFANTFPKRFSGRLVRHYSYLGPKKGFHLSGGDLILGNVLYEQNLFLRYPDFNYDLARTEDLPAEIRKDFERFQTVQTITMATFYISYPTFLVVAIGALVGSFPGEMSVSTGWTIFSISAALTLCTMLAANLNRSKNVSNLNRLDLD